MPEAKAATARTTPSTHSGGGAELASLGLEPAALRSLLAAYPALGTARASVLKELATAGHVLQLDASEWPGFVSGLIRRHGSLEQAALSLGEARSAVERRIALAPRATREANDVIAHTDDLAERSEALSALAASTRRQAISEWSAQVRGEFGLAPPRASSLGDLTEVRAAQSRLAAAHAARAAAERRLSKHLELRGALLTPAQRSAFVAAFQERAKPQLVAEALAAEALATALASCRLPPALLLPAYRALAESPRAEEALRWASRVAGSSPSWAADERLQGIAATALANATAGVVLRADTPAKATSTIEAILAPFIAASKVEGRIDSVATLVKELGDGDEKAVAAAVQRGLTKNPLRRSMQVAALVLALSEAKSNIEKERLLAAIGSLASIGALGISVLTPTAFQLASIARELGYPAAEWHLWALSGLGATASNALLTVSAMTSMWEQLAADDPNLGTYLTVAGTALCAGGSALSAIGVSEIPTGAGAPFGFGKVAIASLATAGGALLAEAGAAVDDAVRAGALAEEARALLEAANVQLAAAGQAPVSAESLSLLASPDVDAGRLAPLGLDGAALQAVAQAMPELFSLPGGLFEALAATAGDLALGGSELVAFLRACTVKFGSLTEAARRLGEERLVALASPAVDPEYQRARAQVRRADDDPEAQAKALEALVRRQSEARRSAWARATRARLGLSPKTEPAPTPTR